MNIPTVITEGLSIVNNPALMIPQQSPGGPIRAQSGIPVVTKLMTSTKFMQGATQRAGSFRVKPCLDTHFNNTFKPGKFKGGMPLKPATGNFRNMKNGLLSEYYIQEKLPLLKPASQFYAQLDSPMPVT